MLHLYLGLRDVELIWHHDVDGWILSHYTCLLHVMFFILIFKQITNVKTRINRKTLG